MRTLLSAFVLLGLLPAQARPPLLVVEVTGTPYERGQSHGRQLRAEIGEYMAAFRKDVAPFAGGDAKAFVARFLAMTHYDDAIRRHTPALLDEVRGIADGAGEDFDTVLVSQLTDEIWAQMPEMFAEKCTTIGVDRRGDQPAFVAQNIDLPTWMHRHPLVLRVRHSDSDLESLVLTMPGQIGALGMNNRRVALGVNTVLQLRACRDGLPVSFIVRGVLEQPDQAAAVAFLQRVTHASGQAYTVGGPEKVRCFEGSAGKVAECRPSPDASCTWHTNHPLASDDWSAKLLAGAKKLGKQPGEVTFPCQRLADVIDHLGGGKPLTVEAVAAVMSSTAHQVCNQGTYMCAIMLLGERPEMRVSPGPPSTTKFETLTFTQPVR
jgi:hypothetical protein